MPARNLAASRSISAKAHQHANICADTFADLPGLDTPATRFCQALARKLDAADWAALHTAVYKAMMLVARCLRSGADGIRLPDRARPGDAFLIFALGDGEGCCCGGNVDLDELDAAREAAIYLTARERRYRLLELTKTARAQRGSMGDARSRELAVEIAGLLVGPAEIDDLREIENALPAFVVLTRRERDRRSVRWKTISSTLPGEWLGTKTPAGSA